MSIVQAVLRSEPTRRAGWCGLVALFAIAGRAAAGGLDSLVISEVRIEQPGPDVDEFFEIRGDPGTSLDNVYYVVVGNDDFLTPPFQNGYVEQAIDLSGSTIPGSGYFVVAKSTFTLGTPDVVKNFDFETGNNKTHLLVLSTGPIVPGYDVDGDKNGVLDLVPWTTVLSSVALIQYPPDGTNGDYVYSTNIVGPDGSGNLPSHIYLCEDGNLYNYGSSTLGGETVGAANPPCGISTVISELRTDQTGSDFSEYFELHGPPGSLLNGLHYLVVGDGAGGSGVIETDVDLAGAVIPADGYLLVAESTFTLGTADVSLTGNALNFENDDNVTHMLVRNFTGALNEDLDTNDDGTFDVTPWTNVLDSIALVLEPNPPTSTEYSYGAASVGPVGGAVPGHAWRKNTSGAWQAGFFDLNWGADTPGAANPDFYPWSDLGWGLAGFNGAPILIASGPCSPSSACGLKLKSARPSSMAALFVNLSGTPVPFKGGMLVPVPPVILTFFNTDVTGTIGLFFAWPSTPAGIPLYFQYAIPDPAAIHGVALSNAVKIVTQ